MDIHTKLTLHFTLNELIRSTSASELGIDNTPPEHVLKNLILLCTNILEPVRAHFELPVRINSGYRCIALNSAINGSQTSQHMTGQAVDFEIDGLANYDLALWISTNLVFDQLILENYVNGNPNSGWVHCSLKKDVNRMQILTINGRNKHPGLIN
ncbi:D-Ala-D-Ala carboxypeptidase family metallohydrolase [Nitrosomonas supralitoralis]|uniref:Peptidase M15A n=1 Tax=Nitrosomonas supralitoralis TaxID=2116706 RepID=A0A2P7NQV3_9PROT|nr:D-Ala-D-Ala carboxypeptidase family metallohydrolase [Nitrosomonas supralitoralis]PSJ15827.1 peptidase M15A [Nitrosomonas supralitoralis]